MHRSWFVWVSGSWFVRLLGFRKEVRNSPKLRFFEHWGQSFMMVFFFVRIGNRTGSDVYWGTDCTCGQPCCSSNSSRDFSRWGSVIFERSALTQIRRGDCPGFTWVFVFASLASSICRLKLNNCSTLSTFCRANAVM
jgi:hypothetical protein